ncbi:MAG: peptidase M55 [Ruminococcaceae bacterium]|nr:peptidase M55 [Oscillospiraceae bacterium]
MEYLVAVDLEGIGGVAGEPFQTLTKAKDYSTACENAVREINSAVKALFDNGATRVAVWDNHGGGGNLDFSKIDPRIEQINWRAYPYRIGFSADYNFAGIIYLGYHSREGTFGGVLAHTYNSQAIQYVKVNGAEVGELEIDTYLAAEYGIPPLLVASDDVCVAQFKKTSPDTVGVITKYGKSRNEAEFKDEDTVVQEIYDGVVKSLKSDIKPVGINCPINIEVRYTRAEGAASIYERVSKDDCITAKYGDDTHTLFFEITKVNRLFSVI